MPLGVEPDNTAALLIQNNGQALVQGIRQIGQQISQHLTEIQTRRDLASLGQEAQTLNPQSHDFPVQLTQLATKHPLAIRDERGQMVLSVLGKANAQWQAEESDARAFNRAMALQGYRSRAALAVEKEHQKRPVNVPRVGLVDPTEVDPVTGQAKVLVAAPAGAEPTPYQATPNGPFDKRTGTYGTPPPALAVKPMTAYQQAQLRRNERKDKIVALNQEINQFDSDISSAVHQYESSFTREQNATGDEKLRHQADKTEIGKVADRLKEEKKKRLDILKQLREEDAKDAAIPADEASLLPPVPADAAAAPAAPANDLVVVINPAGKQVQIKRSQLGAALQGGYKQQ